MFDWLSGENNNDFFLTAFEEINLVVRSDFFSVKKISCGQVGFFSVKKNLVVGLDFFPLKKSCGRSNTVYGMHFSV